MMPHDDAAQDKDMIKSVLQKIIDEMNGMEADRIMPESRKPKVMAAKIDVEAPKDDMAMDSSSEDDSNMDPEVLKQLMDKAGSADESGSMPEDNEADLHPAIADLIRKKKMQKPM